MSKYVSRKIVDLASLLLRMSSMKGYNAILKIIMNMNHYKNWATNRTFAQRKD